MAPPSDSAASNLAIRHDFGAGDTGDAVHGKWYQVWDNAIDEMNQILDALQPEAVSTAGGKYNDVATRMNGTISDLYNHAQTLSDNWGGDDADGAMKQMQKMYDQAQSIQATSSTTGSTLTGHGKTLASYKAPGNRPQGAGGFETGAVAVVGGLVGLGADRSAHNAAARDYMSHLQNATSQANSQFPAHIRSDQASSTQDSYNPNSGNPNSPGGPGVPTGGGGTGAGHIPGAGSAGHIPGTGAGGHIPGTGTGGHIPGTGTGGHIPGTGTGTGTGGDGTNLAGFNPGGGGGAGGGLGGGGLGGGDPLGGAGSGLTGGPGGLGSGLGNGLGAGTGAGAGAGAAGRGMMPMAPGGHGKGEKERERSTWLTEDEDVWGGDGDAAPPLIG